MMNTFPMPIEEIKENSGSEKRFDDLPHYVIDVRKTNLQAKLTWAATVCLVGRVIGGESEDSPRSDTESP